MPVTKFFYDKQYSERLNMCKNVPSTQRKVIPMDINCLVCFENTQREDNTKEITRKFILFPWLLEQIRIKYLGPGTFFFAIWPVMYSIYLFIIQCSKNCQIYSLANHIQKLSSFAKGFSLFQEPENPIIRRTFQNSQVQFDSLI